jgi:hypothetical protein
MSSFLISAGVPSLQDLCSEVIKSAMLQQRTSKPEELVAYLPDYVSLRVKRLITSHLK